MTTILFSAAGAAAGALLGPLGALAGRAAGASLGYLIDQSLLRATQPDSTGPRLGTVAIQGSTEGAAIGRVYGRARLAGEIIWATRYVEVAEESDGGGKGGPTTTTYRYFANFAVALCEGPIDHVGRVFADGVQIDTTLITMRVHLGHEDQDADSLILAKQTRGTPAYRGVAYVVFEGLPLDDYGNRIPQLGFEVVRVVDTLEGRIRAVTLIPGATEYGYGTAEVRRRDSDGWVSENRHVLSADSDLLASLDELTALCPNLERVALVTTWFGSDLRADHCRIDPGVEDAAKATDTAWSVAGIDRASARVVSRVDGAPAFGGTPSDATLLAALREMKARGLEVVLYPFVMMDIPAGNARPDPYGGAEQAAYPWRGRISCHPAPGRPGSPDRTTAAGAVVAAFLGAATAADFTVSGDTIAYHGPDDGGFRRFILHHAHLAALGGADALLLGSEFVGMTTLRDGPSHYPFVAGLVDLAAEVRAVVGSGCQLSYGADWTEYHGHQPADGSGDVHFHLDPFWASADVDFVGIDYYPPLSDWRHEPHLDQDAADTGLDPAYLAAGLAGGEAYDWYYAGDAERAAQTRTPIGDGAAGKPWVFRPKDLAGWWSNGHFDRPGGIERATPTTWVAGMKPIWLTETGCPAVDLGPNRPSVFPDRHSSEAGLPPGSRGARDDLAPRRFLDTVLTAFQADGTARDPAVNPIGADGRPMVPAGAVFAWAWDARPFPAFPQYDDVWSDAANWAAGHWLNGRLGGASVAALIRAVLADHDFDAVETTAVGGHVDGFVVDDRLSARATLEPLLAAFFIDALDTGTAIRFAGRQRRAAIALAVDDLGDDGEAARVEIERAEAASLPTQVTLTSSDALADFRRSTVGARLEDSDGSGREASADLALVLPGETAAGLAETWLRDARVQRETAQFGLGPKHMALEPGDIIALPFAGGTKTMMIERIEDGVGRRITARGIDPGLYTPLDTGRRGGGRVAPATFAAPDVVVLDIARIAATDAHRPLIAVGATPWPGAEAVLRIDPGGGIDQILTLTRRATLGTTRSRLEPAAGGLWDRGSALEVELDDGALATLADAAVLAGGNTAAVALDGGGFEVIQFAGAELIGPRRWRLTRLLRGLRGSQDGTPRPSPTGSRFVMLDAAVVPLPVGLDDVGQTVALAVGASRSALGGSGYASVAAEIGGRGVRPFAPIHLRGRRTAATGDLAVTWTRRSRAEGADSWTLADAPLDEAVERYRVEVLDGATVRRAVDIDTAAWTYTAADQTADFGGPVDRPTLRIAQIGALTGPGLPLTATPRPTVA
jgi:hypothetical protein